MTEEDSADDSAVSTASDWFYEELDKFPSLSSEDMTEDQITALSQLTGWLKSEYKCYSLGGYAGTGKTTLLQKFLRNEFSNIQSELGNVVCMTFTGRASSVLRSKGLISNTIHSSIYTFQVDKTTGRFTRSLNSMPDVGLVCVDEASMLPAELFEDMQKAMPNAKFLFVGDVGQLPAINESAHVMDRPSYVLRQVTRNPSGIIILAMQARLGNDPLSTMYNPDVLKDVEFRSASDFFDLGTQVDQCICGYNNTRVDMNRHCRIKLKYSGVLQDGERVICLRNNREVGVYNGLIGTVNKVNFMSRHLIEADIDFTDGTSRTVFMKRDQFGRKEMLGYNEVLHDMASHGKELCYFDYAYCVTCHKAQGGEAPVVAVLEQPTSAEARDAWLYTAVTRASEKLYYCSSRLESNGDIDGCEDN